MVHLEIPGKNFPETSQEDPEVSGMRRSLGNKYVFGFWCCPVAYSVPISFPNMEKASSE